MDMFLDIIQWFIDNADTIQQIHDNTVDELIRHFELYVAYHQVREIHQDDDNKEEPSTPDQEHVDSSEKTSTTTTKLK